ncbi:sugar transferase [Marinifilum fragile]|uniref:sugar transferase n=1 Tax=Marinifilum fragile TaxID=570161 RepID=UPI002AA7FB7C|nr:sugar transferase [Marinifilum fragile]
MYGKFYKRVIDVLAAAVLLVVSSPLFILVIVLVKLSSSGPVFFTQDRVGINKTSFIAYKFRTMYNRQREVNREIFKDDVEVTKVGKYLRRYKIDELPQLINVLIGDMSLVGPRPSINSLVEKFNEDGEYRIKVKPGLTGLAQINGNIHLSWPERWKYDRYYVENISFLLDLKILFKTFSIVLFGEDKFIKKIS